MQVGIVAPVKYLHLCSSELQLCYATLLHHSDYLDFYRNCEGIVLLDYSPNLPRRYELDNYLWGVELLRSTFVVLPSIDYSSSRTISLAKSFMRVSKSKRLVGVVQGIDLDTLSRCYRFLREYCSLIALPSPLESIARREEVIRDLNIKEKVVYLEVYSNPYEEVPPTSSLGICTSFPVRLAADLRKLEEFTPTPSPLDFSKTDLIESLVEGNVSGYMEVLRYAGGSKK